MIRLKSYRRYLGLRSLPASARSKVYRCFRRRLQDSLGPGCSWSMNPAKRELLHDAIFEVENDYESKGEGRPDHPVVSALRSIRNRVADDLGWHSG